MKKTIMIGLIMILSGCHYFIQEHQKYQFKNIKVVPNKCLENCGRK